MPKNFLFTSESVAPGHPDKLCDQVSDLLLDLYLAKDPHARVAIESFATIDNLIIGGEIRAPEISKSEIDSQIRNLIKNIGFKGEKFHPDKIKITNLIHKQSADIALGVDGHETKEEGAGDQGIMFGYACDETEALMPAPIYYSHKVLAEIFAAIEEGKKNGTQIALLGPDAKSQITLKYHDGKPIAAKKVLVSIQHHPDLSIATVRELIRPLIIKALPAGFMCAEEDFLVNPTGRFVIGGPESDTGLTGRKIIVDTYGGSAPHGGGAFSGKDPTKVDRSAAYMARYLAKNIVAAGLAKRSTIQLSYAIGVAKPLSVYVNNHRSGIHGEKIARFLSKNFDLSPKAIRTHLKLNIPIYQPSATFGHFGRTPTSQGHFSWEKMDLVEVLRKELL